VVNIFRSEGVANVAWVWNANTFPPAPSKTKIDSDLESFYPGDDFVDWVGADHYDYGSPKSPTDNPLQVGNYLDPVYAFALKHDKPFFLGEWGIRHAASKLTAEEQEKWLNLMFDYFEKHPKIKAIAYCNFKESTSSQSKCKNPTWLEDNKVNYCPNINDNDHRLLAESGASFRNTFKRRISNKRYISELVVN